MRDRRQCPLVWVMAHNIKLLALYAQHKWTMHTRNLLFLFLCFLFVFSFSFHQVYNERVLLEHYKLHWDRSGAIGNRHALYIFRLHWMGATSLNFCSSYCSDYIRVYLMIDDQFWHFFRSIFWIKIFLWVIELL